MRIPALIATPLVALAVSAGAGGLGLAVNALRPDGLRLVAAFPHEQECPEKLERSSAAVTAAQAVRLRRVRGVLLLDARPAEDFAQGHLPDARSLPYSFVAPPDAAVAATLRPFANLVVYCDSPNDQLAALLAAQLRGLGLPGVRVLRGGLEAYHAAARTPGGSGAAQAPR